MSTATQTKKRPRTSAIPRRPSRVKKTGKMTFAEWANGAAGIVNTGKGILSTREGFDN
ncbi:hypothetical protein [Geminisphaera colitermitum]|uniref:hypothetical protein n=1 Tax=Geminisphaera colitermitum TaxID=1148786 RepID=UPI0001964E25|nr:hypothetical protein [Geminisphaera colitermitum]